MSIPIFRAEKSIAHLIKANASIAYLSPIVRSGTIEEVGHTVASKANPDQPDLFYMDSILVSTNWNNNDDVFQRENVWAARNTPEDKPFNYMHDEKTNIGHITNNIIAVENGEIYTGTDMPEGNFDILISSVLYRRWTDKKLLARSERLIKEIQEGGWFVSMECMFKGFDYAIRANTGEEYIIAREESTAFLSKHLRSYGGSGKFNGFKIGRVVKNICFAGVGLVDKPANWRSVILSSSKFLTSGKGDFSLNRSFPVYIDNDSTIVKAFQLKEKQMDEQALQNLQAEFNQVKAELAKSAEALKADLATKDQLIAELKASVADFQAAKTAVEAQLVVACDKLKSIEKSNLAMARKSQLVGLGLTNDEADATMAKFSEVSDEVFASVVEIKAEAVKAKENPFSKKDDCKDEEDDKAEKASKALDNTKEEATAALNVDDKAGDSVAFAAAQSYFETVFGIKKENK